ncbi:MAG: homocysteine S-methyltransferase family protein [Christensenellaceae bacterium]|nr:homocysteine S-methyltransferase family protein [Christensenellaceae bacterium]
MNFIEFINSNRFYLDGGMGASLIDLGFDANDAEKLNFEHPDVIIDVHDRFLQAGSNIIYTNTFGANSRKYSLSELERVIECAVDNAVKATKAHKNAYIAYDCGPIGVLLEPYTEYTADYAYQIFAEQARIVARLNVDCVIIETITDMPELKSAILAFKENTNLPIMCSMSFSENKRTFTGTPVAAFCLLAQSLSVDAIGINCSLGADKMLPLAEELCKYAAIPTFIKPNAGLPTFSNGKAIYDSDANDFSKHMYMIAKLGIPGLGGCCGTTPEYIRLTKELTSNCEIVINKSVPDAICSGRAVVAMDRFNIIGERVNPTGKANLKKSLLNDQYDVALSMCVEQESEGATILDLNAGMSGISEAEKLKKLTILAGGVVSTPLQIDTTKIDALELSLRALNGVGIINSVNADQESMHSVFPIAKKYGAYVIGLCLDSRGIPSTPSERVALASLIIDEAAKYGIDKNKILIDPLTMAASVDVKNPQITLDTIKLINDKLGVKTVIGLSNVSFGLPDRDVVNASFYKMCLAVGISAVIINPKLKPKSDPYADKLLLGLDDNCAEYIKSRRNVIDESTHYTQKKIVSVEECILKGLIMEGRAIIKENATLENYSEIIQTEIISGLNKLGTLFETGKVFLPQLIAGADVAKAMLEYIRANFMLNESDGETMLLATVKGDIHDIGKNIVKAVLANYGYNIIDLGKDVSTEKIIDAVKKHRPKYVGLSALMTTTMENMRESAKAVLSYDPNITVLVGGAVVTEEFAHEISPLVIYSKDAQDAASKLMKARDIISAT